MRITVLLLAAACCLAGCQSSTSEEPAGPGIQWMGKNEAANEAAAAGIRHFVNVEVDKAFTMFEHAVDLDSSLFAPHTMLALMADGEKREYHQKMAAQFVADKNEVSKMFVSLIDAPRDSIGARQNREVWAKMHEAAPDGLFIHYMYARTRTLRNDTVARMAALDDLIVAAEKSSRGRSILAGALNLKGYMLQITGDLEGGTAAIERYLKEYPEGYNPLDSRAEFYLFAGDTANAIVWYKKVLERYPFSNSAIQALRELEPQD